MNGFLSGKKGLVVGIANDQSIAWGCARALRDAGADLAVTWFNDKARPYVAPLAHQLQADIAMPLDVEQPGEMEACLTPLPSAGADLIFCCTPLRLRPRAICTAA